MKVNVSGIIFLIPFRQMSYEGSTCDLIFCHSDNCLKDIYLLLFHRSKSTFRLKYLFDVYEHFACVYVMSMYLLHADAHRSQKKVSDPWNWSCRSF